MKIQWKTLLLCVAIPLTVGVLSAFLTGNSMRGFETLNKPALSPPWVAVPRRLVSVVYSDGGCFLSGCDIR